MKSILFSQANDATSKDIYVINGVVSLDEQTNEQMSASNKLFECHEWGMYHKNNILALKKEGKLLESTFVSFRKGTGFYFSSNYSNKDIVGRLITFQFFCATEDFSHAIDEFVRLSKLINREYSASEIESLKEAVLNQEKQHNTPPSNNNNKLWLYILCAIAFFILFVKGCSK